MSQSDSHSDLQFPALEAIDDPRNLDNCAPHVVAGAVVLCGGGSVSVPEFLAILKAELVAVYTPTRAALLAAQERIAGLKAELALTTAALHKAQDLLDKWDETEMEMRDLGLSPLGRVIKRQSN